MKSPSTPPKLAAPGAGLPKPERFIANLRIRWNAARTTREQAAANFAAEQAAILDLLKDHDAATLSQQVLIKRLRGLEDSSRFWSLLMVVDHLRIVNREITGVIASLGAGRIPSGEASTAAVKPSTTVTQDVIVEFNKGCGQFAAIVAALPDLKTTVQFPHPWFGPMDAATWHFMAGFHMRLHRRQMQLILAGMEKE